MDELLDCKMGVDQETSGLIANQVLRLRLTPHEMEVISPQCIVWKFGNGEKQITASEWLKKASEWLKKAAKVR